MEAIIVVGYFFVALVVAASVWELADQLRAYR